MMTSTGAGASIARAGSVGPSSFTIAGGTASYPAASLVTHEEMDGFPVVTRSRFGVEAKTQYKCAWADRHTLATDLLETFGQAFPGFSAARVRTITIKPFEAKNLGSGNVNAYEFALLDVDYATPTLGDPEVITLPGGGGEIEISETLEPTAEYRTIPKDGLFWTGFGTPAERALKDGEEPARLEHGFEYVVTKYHVLSVPNIAEYAGSVNIGTLTPKTPGLTNLPFAPETLLFKPPTLHVTTSELGLREMTLTFRFGWKPNGWNHTWRAETQTYERMLVGQDGEQYNNFPLKEWVGV